MRHSTFGRALYELFSSMRFAVSLLVIIAIAATMGTVLKQDQAYTDYIVQFGEFWFRPFEAIGLFDVYHAGWFLALLAFLVLSTSTCIYRHVPGVLRDIRHYREQAALKSLRAMAHHVELAQAGSVEQTADALNALFVRGGYRVKRVVREDGLMLASKKGSMQRMGYLLAHSAIVLGCLGFLLDGNPVLKLQRWLHLKVEETRFFADAHAVPPQSRLGTGNLAFRADIELPEGESGDTAQLMAGRGYFIQDLPFTIHLKQFHVEHYSTGQPKLFASDIDVTEKATGRVVSGTTQVNHPLIVDGIAIYQASFGDGGSPVEFKLWDWSGKNLPAQSFKATSRNSRPLSYDGKNLTLELEDFRAFNIEDVGDGSVPGQKGLSKRFEDAREVKAVKHVKNFGPSIQFKVRDAEGQAREYINYLAPLEAEGQLYLVTGMRADVQAPFDFTYIPLDADGKPDSFMRLRAVMLDKSMSGEIAKRAASRVRGEGDQQAQVRQGIEQGLNLVLQHYISGGLPELVQFVNERFPLERRQGAQEATGQLLERAEYEAINIAQERAGLPPVDISQPDERRDRFYGDALLAMSTSLNYGNEFYLQPVGFTEVKASTFQLTRAPGQPLVYLGSVMLVLGIFCMFYIRENRVWIWLSEGRLLLAFTSNRQDSQTDREFATYQAAIRQLEGISELPT